MTKPDETTTATGAPFERPVTALQRYLEADDALVYHERPYYRACAGGTHFERTETWEMERARLTTEWCAAEAAAFGRPATQKQAPGLLQRIGAWLRRNAESNGGESHPTRVPCYRAGTTGDRNVEDAN